MTELTEQEVNTLFLKASLQKCLPSLKADQLETISLKLAEGGLTEELKSHATPERLLEYGLNIWQASALVKLWSADDDGAGSSNQHPEINNEQLVNTKESVHGFKLDWTKILALRCKYGRSFESARECLTKQKRPSPRLRKLIVEEVVTQIYEKIVRPVRNSVEGPYKEMIDKYPKSFTELLGAGTECVGGLLTCLRIKFDNDGRPDRNLHLRSETALAAKWESPRGKFAYGCIRWRAKDHPNGLTNKDIEVIKGELKTVYETVRPKNWNVEEISVAMKNTYKVQRDLINTNVEQVLACKKKVLAQKRKASAKKGKGKKSNKNQIEEDDDNSETEDNPTGETTNNAVTANQIYLEFPFLFTYEGMLPHFKELTKVDAAKELDKYMKEEIKDVISYYERELDEFIIKTLKVMDLSKKKHPADKQSIQLKGLLTILSYDFEEDPLFLIVDESETMETLQQQKKVPQYPTLMIPAKAGSIFRAKKYFFGLDSELFFSFSTFEKAFKCLYMAYYIFNINYPPLSQASFEYVQRCIMHMDVVTGNKRPSKGEGGHFSTKVVHPKVARVHKKVHELLRSKADVDVPLEEVGSGESDCD